MPTLTQPPDAGTDPLPPPGVTPYFRLCAEVRTAVEQEEARRGLAPEAA